MTLRRTPRDAAVSLPDVGGAERDGGALVADASGGDASALDELGAAARDGGVDVTSVDSRDGGSR